MVLQGIDVSKVQIEDIPDGICRAIAEEIGIENYIKLSRLIGGDVVYLPREEAFLRNVRDKLIIEEYKGYNVKEVARKYGITVKWVREIAKRHEEKQSGL